MFTHTHAYIHMYTYIYIYIYIYINIYRYIYIYTSHTHSKFTLYIYTQHASCIYIYVCPLICHTYIQYVSCTSHLYVLCMHWQLSCRSRRFVPRAETFGYGKQDTESVDLTPAERWGNQGNVRSDWDEMKSAFQFPTCRIAACRYFGLRKLCLPSKATVFWPGVREFSMLSPYTVLQLGSFCFLATYLDVSSVDSTSLVSSHGKLMALSLLGSINRTYTNCAHHCNWTWVGHSDEKKQR